MPAPGSPSPSRQRHAPWHVLQAPGPVPRALRWGTVVSAGLLFSALLTGPRMASYSLLGAQTAQAGWLSPLRPRLARLAGAGVAVLVGEALGMLVSDHAFWTPLAMGAFTWAVMWSWHALRLGSPGPVNIVMGGAMGTYMGLTSEAVHGLLLMTVLGWVLVSALSVLVLLTGHHLPEREAVDDATQAVTAFLDDDGQSARDTNLLRRRAWTHVHRAFAVLLADRRPGTPVRSPTVQSLLARLTTLYGALIARLQHDLAMPETRALAPVTPLGDPPVRYLLRTARARTSQPSLLATRAALAVALAAAVSLVCGVDRPYWAMLSAAIVLHMGTARHDLTVRAVHRVLGTCLGVALYFVVQRIAPGEWVRLGIVVVALYVTELVISRMYALGVTFITLYALLTLPVRTEVALTTAMRDRVLETLIGVACALLLTRLLGRRFEQAAVAHQYLVTMSALRTELAHLAGQEHAGTVMARRDLVFELGRSGTLLLAVRAAETPEGRGWLDIHRSLTEFGYELIAVAQSPRGLDPETAADLVRQVEAIAAPGQAQDALLAGIRRAQRTLVAAVHPA